MQALTFGSDDICMAKKLLVCGVVCSNADASRRAKAPTMKSSQLDSTNLPSGYHNRKGASIMLQNVGHWPFLLTNRELLTKGSIESHTIKETAGQRRKLTPAEMMARTTHRGN